VAECSITVTGAAWQGTATPGWWVSGFRQAHEDLTPDACPTCRDHEAIDEAPASTGAPDLDVLVTNGLIAVHEVRVVKARARNPPRRPR